MILPVHERLRERLLTTLQHLYQVPPDALPQLPIEYPPKRELGDLATPVAFELARRLRKAPRVIAQELAAALGPLDGVVRVEAAPNGYLNIYLDRVAFVKKVVPLGSDPRTGYGGQTRTKPSSSTPPSTRTRRRTSAIFAIPRWATRSYACSASEAFPSRCRTTSTTPASRWPTSSSDFASSKTRRSRTSAPSRTRRGSTTTAGISTRASRSGTTKTKSASRFARLRCTISSTAARRRQKLPRSSPNASSDAT